MDPSRPATKPGLLEFNHAVLKGDQLALDTATIAKYERVRTHRRNEKQHGVETSKARILTNGFTNASRPRNVHVLDRKNVETLAGAIGSQFIQASLFTVG